MIMTADDILVLLENRHSDDLFVPECKDGSTFGGHFRLDAWVMKKSWANPLSIGYEIKVSRSDWLNDKKVHVYMNYCHQMYIVAPPGIVKKEELPDGVGLIIPSSTGSRLYTKIKAKHRSIEWPIDLLRYILMSRTKIVKPYTPMGNRTIFWENWLTQKVDDYKYGKFLGKRIRQKIESDILSVHRENEKLKRENERLQDWSKILSELNINKYFVSKKTAVEALESVRSGFNQDFKDTLRRSLRDIKQLSGNIEQLYSEIAPSEDINQ
jgi:hypothetical protein